jgi:uncharacterized protein
MRFESDLAEDASYRRKHGIGFREAAEIFRGPVLIAEDTRRDYGEQRFVALGDYDWIRVIFTERNGATRIISAWKASSYDRKIYKKAHADHNV